MVDRVLVEVAIMTSGHVGDADAKLMAGASGGGKGVVGEREVEEGEKGWKGTPPPPSTPGPYTFHYSQHYHSFSFFCPLVDLPASFFTRNLPVPPRTYVVSRDSSRDELDFKHSD